MKLPAWLVLGGLLVGFGTSCRAPQAVFSPPRSTVYAPAPEHAAADSVGQLAPLAASPSVSAVVASSPGTAARPLPANIRPTGKQVGRMVQKRVSRLQQQVRASHAPANHAIDGIFSALLLVLGCLAALTILIVLAATSPTTLAGHIAIGILIAIGAFVLGLIAYAALQ
jgi:hypothetical protein